ncbi:MAG: preprotein translocase subunit SecE [bacterium]
MASVKQSRKKPGLIRRLSNFFREVRAELKKVIWPSREEVAKYTAVVLFMIAVLGAFIALVDQLVARLTKWLLGW